MPYNGSGVFTLVSGNPVVTGTVISSTVQNNTMADIVNNGLTNCLTKDGQQTPTANIPLGGFRLTGVGNAVNLQDAVTAAQLQTGNVTSLSGVAGTDTITALAAPAPAAYAAGQVFDFIAAGTNTTGVVTLNISSLGAKAITKYGALGIQAGDIVSGQSVRVRYDGTQFQMISPASAVPTITGGVRNLVMLVSAASASATMTADEIILVNSLGGPAFVLSNFSKTINLATTGAGGMDTGSAPVSGYVALYAIYNPTTGVSALLARNATSVAPTSVYSGANMPSGYTASALVSIWPTNASSLFQVAFQQDRSLDVGQVQVLATSSIVGTPTALSLASVVPPGARSFDGMMQIGSSTNAVSTISLTPSSLGGVGTNSLIANIPGGGSQISPFRKMKMSTSQTTYYSTNTSAGTMTAGLFVTGYDF